VESIRAFRFDGTAGILMHVGTWHEFPFVETDDTDVVVVLRGEALRDLKNVQGTEAHGGDLDKNDLQARLGLVLELDLP
jgi:ureidoglycolate lyase